MQRDGQANRYGDHGIHQAIIDPAFDFAALERNQPVFCELHASRLRASHQHVHLGFEAAEFFQHFLLKIVVRDPHHERLPGSTRMARGFDRKLFVKLLMIAGSPNAAPLYTANTLGATRRRIGEMNRQGWSCRNSA